MPEPRDVHRATTDVLSVALIVLGVAMLVSTVARGGSPIALGVILGLLFVGAGTGRIYVSRSGR